MTLTAPVVPTLITPALTAPRVSTSRRPLRVLVAPSGFKESLGPDEVAAAIAAGVRRAAPDAHIRSLPLVDGGEGFTKALVGVTGGSLHDLTVTGPVGEPVPSYYGFLGGPGERTAVLEMAAAAGLRLVPHEHRNPAQTTTYGVGELVRAALGGGAARLLVGCGDSGTNDAGAGAAQALGVRLLDRDGHDLERGGGELVRLEHIDLSGRDPRLGGVRIDVACNWSNVLCGPRGVARTFGPQKGATPAQVKTLEQGLERFAEVVARDVGVDVATMPGGGASGGLGAGLAALLGATLRPRYDLVMQYFELDALLAETDLVITAEGQIDAGTPHGKVPAEVARRAKRYGLPVVAVAGSVGAGASVNHAHGIDVITSISDGPRPLAEAIERTPELLEQAAESVVRTLLVGSRLPL